jgi:hypothetical protein
MAIPCLEKSILLAIPRVFTTVADVYQGYISINRVQLCRCQSWRYYVNKFAVYLIAVYLIEVAIPCVVSC